jgi:hypothetical protein
MIGIKYIYLRSYGEDLILMPRHGVVYPEKINMSDDETCMEFPLSDDCDVIKKIDNDDTQNIGMATWLSVVTGEHEVYTFEFENGKTITFETISSESVQYMKEMFQKYIDSKYTKLPEPSDMEKAAQLLSDDEMQYEI